MLLLASLTSIVPGLLCAWGHPEGEDKSLHQNHLGWGPGGLWGFSLAASAHSASKPKPFYSDTLLSTLPCSPAREDLHTCSSNLLVWELSQAKAPTLQRQQQGASLIQHLQIDGHTSAQNTRPETGELWQLPGKPKVSTFQTIASSPSRLWCYLDGNETEQFYIKYSSNKIITIDALSPLQPNAGGGSPPPPCTIAECD